MKRMFNVCCTVEDKKMQNYGNVLQLNATPMTHKEACAFLSKLIKYKWRRDFLVEIA